MARRMNKILIIGVLLTAAFAMVCAETQAQRMPERRLVRRGNRQYDRGNYVRSIGFYEQALQKDSTSFEALYDLGNALSHTDSLEAAGRMLLRAAMDSSRSDEERAEAFFNLGDIQFRQQNLKGSLECFKNSLRLNPSDMEAKYNYAYVKKLLEQQDDEQEQNNDRNNNQNNDQNNQNNQDNQDNQDNENNEKNNEDRNQDNQDNGGGDDDNNGDGQDEQPSDGEGQEHEGDGRRQTGISPEQAEAMLEAIQAQEDKTQDKVKEKQGVIIRGKKNW